VHPATLLTGINERHGTTFALAERFGDGESASGAYAVVDAAGRRGVLKWDLDPDPAGVVERLRQVNAATSRLRERGYPVPLYLVLGHTATACYSIQELLPGRPLRAVTPDVIPRLLELNTMQRGLSMPGHGDWPRRVVDTVLFGGEGYCLLEPLQTYSNETSELLDNVQAIVRHNCDREFETGDLVHFDFNPTNILVDQGRISGVIDWQEPCSGDCAFDLATLMFYAWRVQAVRDLLWRHLLERIEPGALGVYLAHLILRQVDWSIRHHGDRETRHFLNVAREILSACRVAGVNWA